MQPLEALDPRLKVIPRDGFQWDSYKILDDLGVFSDVTTIPWKDGGTSRFRFVTSIFVTL